MERTNPLYKARLVCQKIAYKVLLQETPAEIHSHVTLHEGIDFVNPRTFNEKVHRLKIHSFSYDPLVVRCADKYAMRGYVEEKGLGEALVPSLRAWASLDDIDWGMQFSPKKYDLA